jgi:membrane-associated phospholipid phosphatase
MAEKVRSIPVFVDERNRTYWASWVFAFVAGSYLYTNHYPLRIPMQIPFTAIDHAIPFLPWTVWIYMSDYFIFILSFFPMKNPLKSQQFLMAMIGTHLISLIFFLGWPTTYPRDTFPLPTDIDTLSLAAFHWLRVTDSPNNCFPSLHVSSAVMSALLWYGESRTRFILFSVWALAIAVSTLTTKQHYLADIVGGISLALAGYFFFFNWLTYRNVDSMQTGSKILQRF